MAFAEPQPASGQQPAEVAGAGQRRHAVVGDHMQRALPAGRGSGFEQPHHGPLIFPELFRDPFRFGDVKVQKGVQFRRVKEQRVGFALAEQLFADAQVFP